MPARSASGAESAHVEPRRIRDSLSVVTENAPSALPAPAALGIEATSPARGPRAGAEGVAAAGNGGGGGGAAGAAEVKGKFEAGELILGKSEDSDLTKFIGLTEHALAEALLDPIGTMEKEWYPYGFQHLDDEPKVGEEDYGDSAYSSSLQALVTQLSEGAMEEATFDAEKSRLDDEYEERRYEWWKAGAMFDYIRYGSVSHPDQRKENIWMPPHVNHSLDSKKYHGGHIEPEDFDSGSYDTPALVLEMSIDEEQLGFVSIKGHDSDERKEFKRKLALDLASAASISISPEHFAVVNVAIKQHKDAQQGVASGATQTPSVTASSGSFLARRSPAAAGVQATLRNVLGVASSRRVAVVSVHILQSLPEDLGPTEVWAIARDLCQKSLEESDKDASGSQTRERSCLEQGAVTKCLLPGGVRLVKERVRHGMTLKDFTEKDTCEIADLEAHHVAAARLYSSDAYPLFNKVGVFAQSSLYAQPFTKDACSMVPGATCHLFAASALLACLIFGAGTRKRTDLVC